MLIAWKLYLGFKAEVGVVSRPGLISEEGSGSRIPDISPFGIFAIYSIRISFFLDSDKEEKHSGSRPIHN